MSNFLLAFTAFTSYRIYSHISQEILDKIFNLNWQFDLYAGHKLVEKRLLKLSANFSFFINSKFSLIKLINVQI